jgi:apolipoprotein N-acyltransferase
MIRVANKGVSAVINAAGRVRVRVDLDTIGYAGVMLPASGQPHALWMSLATSSASV